MRRLYQLSTLGLCSALLLSSCLRSQNGTVMQSGALNRAAVSNLSHGSEPVFGNTQSNVRQIQQKPYDGVIRFVVMGDNRNSSPFSNGGDRVYSKVIQKVNELNPNFAMNLGDFTFDSLRPHWSTFERITGKVQVPYLTVVGNHDNLFGRSYYESRFTPPNSETGLDDYAFEYGNTRFIVVDTANFNLTERQFQWLEKQYQTPLNTVVFSHTPPSHGVWEHKLAPSPEVTRRWIALNAKYQVSHVFLGHIHLFDQRTFDGVNYTISGGGGAPLDNKTSYGQSVYHVVMAEIRGNQVTTQMIPIDTRIQTHGPTAYTDGLDAHDMQNPAILKQFPEDYIPPEEQGQEP